MVETSALQQKIKLGTRYYQKVVRTRISTNNKPCVQDFRQNLLQFIVGQTLYACVDERARCIV